MRTERIASLVSFFFLLLAVVLTPAIALAASFTHEKTLLPETSVANGVFGDAVAIDGDTAVVAAPGDASRNGALHVFERNGGDWIYRARLITGDNPGEPLRAVAISGGTIVAGRSTESHQQGSKAGAVYLFEKPQGGWRDMSQASARLTAQDGATDRTFGTAVAIEGDTLVVGAAGRRYSHPGAAYVFQRSGTQWMQVAKLTASDGVDGDLFGFSLDMDGDRVVVGAYGKEEDRGAAYLYIRPESGWTDGTEDFVLSPSELSEGDLFGFTVAVHGNSVVAGADRDDQKGNDAGAVYLYSGGDWSMPYKIVPEDGFENQGFGYAVDIDGGTIAVGAVLDNRNGDKSGSIYLYRISGGVAEYLEELGAPDGAAEDRFGSAVALSGNWLLVGAYSKEVDSRFSAGSGYIFARDGDGFDGGDSGDSGDSGDRSGSGADRDDGGEGAGGDSGSGGGGATGPWLPLMLTLWLMLRCRRKGVPRLG